MGTDVSVDIVTDVRVSVLLYLGKRVLHISYSQ